MKWAFGLLMFVGVIGCGQPNQNETLGLYDCNRYFLANVGHYYVCKTQIYDHNNTGETKTYQVEVHVQQIIEDEDIENNSYNEQF